MNRGIYRRVPGVGRSSNMALSTRHRLWLAPDHVLSVCNQGYSEDYKRFYFRDIQAITLRQSFRGRVINAVFASLTLMFGATALYGRTHAWDSVGVWILVGFAAFFALALLINMAMGPTCVCFLRTAVQTERLFSLVRVRTALRALRLIRAAVEAEQGALTPDAVDAQAAHVAASGAPTTARSHESAGSFTVAGVKPYRGRAHAALFTVLLVDMYHGLLQFVWQSTVMYVCGMVILAALVSTLIMAMIRQAGTELPRGLKTMTWWSMGYLIVSQMANTVVVFVFTLQRAGGPASANQWAALRAVWTTSPFDSIPLLITLVGSIVCSGVLAALGWTQLRAFHRQRRPPALAGVPPLPPV